MKNNQQVITTVNNYIEMISDFVNSKISVEEFERSFLHYHRRDNVPYPYEIHKTISILFSDIDQYFPIPDGTNNTIDEKTLRERAVQALEKLKVLIQ